jgi:hypothetical protein
MAKLSSDEWVNLLDLVIADPDGWDRTNFRESWAEPITIDEFKSRASRSTVDMRRFTEIFGQ